KTLHADRPGEIRLSNSGTHARVMIALEGVAVLAPDSRPLIRIPKLHIFQSDRVVVLGHNGTGKSRLLEVIARAIRGSAVQGMRITPSLEMGYADQTMSQLPGRLSPFAWVNQNFDVGDHRCRALLAGAGFS